VPRTNIPRVVALSGVTRCAAEVAVVIRRAILGLVVVTGVPWSGPTAAVQASVGTPRTAATAVATTSQDPVLVVGGDIACDVGSTVTATTGEVLVVSCDRVAGGGEQHQQDAGERSVCALTPRVPGPGRTGTRGVFQRRGGRVRGATDRGSPRRLRGLRRSRGTRTLAGGQRTGQLPPRDRPGLRAHLRFPGEPRHHLSAVRPVVPGGWNVIGPSWVLHVETQSLATEIQQQIGGSTHPAA